METLDSLPTYMYPSIQVTVQMCLLSHCNSASRYTDLSFSNLHSSTPDSVFDHVCGITSQLSPSLP